MKRDKLLMISGILLLAIFAFSCGGSGAANSSKNSAAQQPMLFGALASEFKQSKEATRDKYKGKTLTIKGYTSIAPIMPTGADDAGILSLHEKGGDMLYMLSCQFTAAEKGEFSRITGDQMVTVTGVYDDDLTMKLKSCRVLNVE